MPKYQLYEVKDGGTLIPLSPAQDFPDTHKAVVGARTEANIGKRVAVVRISAEITLKRQEKVSVVVEKSADGTTVARKARSSTVKDAPAPK